MIVYVLTEEDCDPETAIHGIYHSRLVAEAAYEILIDQWVEEILADDPKETGVDINDIGALRKDCRTMLKIIEREVY